MIKVSGALKGVVRLPSFGSTVGDLRAEVARLISGDLCVTSWWPAGPCVTVHGTPLLSLARMEPACAPSTHFQHASSSLTTCKAGWLVLPCDHSSCSRVVCQTNCPTHLSAGVDDPSSIKLIAGGKTLQDDTKPVNSYNIGPTTRVLVTKGAAAQHAVSAQEAAQRSEEARLAQLERLKATVEKLASRGDGRGLTDKYEFSLENQVSM